MNRDFKPGIIYEELVARMTGPAALQLQGVFLTDYFAETDTDLFQPEFFVPAAPTGNTAAQALPSGPGFPQANMQRLVLSLLYSRERAHRDYDPVLHSRRIPARRDEDRRARGVEVHLVVSRQADQVLVCHAQRSYYDELLVAGVRIHVYREHLMHAKHLSFDDQIAVIGSSNLDLPSFLLNEEISLIVYDPEVAGRIRRIQERYFAESDELNLDGWRHGPG